MLAALHATDYERLLPHLKSVPLPLGWALYGPDKRMHHVYFPTSGIVSLLKVMRISVSVEFAP